QCERASLALLPGTGVRRGWKGGARRAAARAGASQSGAGLGCRRAGFALRRGLRGAATTRTT
ncbi:MAG: hypothetical protein AB7G48_19510, partial [Nitrospiraceae bacterium]